MTDAHDPRLDTDTLDRHLAGTAGADDVVRVSAWLGEHPDHARMLDALREGIVNVGPVSAETRAADWATIANTIAREAEPVAIPRIAPAAPMGTRVRVRSPFLTATGIVCIIATFASGLYIGRLSSTVPPNQRPTSALKSLAADGKQVAEWGETLVAKIGWWTQIAIAHTASMMATTADVYRHPLGKPSKSL
jgi:hypothetical protein